MERATDSDSQEMLSFLWILRSWLMECSAHGVPKVISSANFHRKIFWLLAVVVCALCFLYQFTDMMVDVYGHPVTVNLQIKHREKLEFPTVTVCNSNKFKDSLIRNYDKDNSDRHKVLTFEDFNSIGLSDIYNELINIGSIVSNSTNETFAKPQLSKEIPRCDYAWDYDTAGANDFFCVEDNQCIIDTWLCDDYLDCSDFSDEDEAFCGSTTCEIHEYQCNNGACIESKKRLVDNQSF